MQLQKIVPFLWFDKDAEEAAQFYVSVFKEGSVKTVSHYDEASAKASGQPVGSAMVVEFELGGQKFSAINAGPVFKFNEAISFMVQCEDQAEIDYFWTALSAHPESEQCGWLKDRYGLSWQIVPSNLGEIMTGPGSGKASAALMQMKKIDIAALHAAAEG